jgi:hypothetical protein
MTTRPAPADEESTLSRPVSAPLAEPPAWIFHLVLAFGSALWLLSASVPGLAVLPYFGAVLTLVPLVGLWLVKLGSAVRTGRVAWRFGAAPVAGVVVVLLLATNAPLTARWTMSRAGFGEQAQRVLPVGRPEVAAGDMVPVDVPGRIGAYSVSAAYLVTGGGVVFYEANGALFDDAGFAYLPKGPSPALSNGSFEGPQFRHLGGPWYAWTASW